MLARGDRSNPLKEREREREIYERERKMEWVEGERQRGVGGGNHGEKGAGKEKEMAIRECMCMHVCVQTFLLLHKLSSYLVGSPPSKGEISVTTHARAHIGRREMASCVLRCSCTTVCVCVWAGAPTVARVMQLVHSHLCYPA